MASEIDSKLWLIQKLFDSLGIDDKKETLIRKFIPERFCILYNATAFQPKTSDKCGLFCLYFLIHKHYNSDSSMHEILSKIFTTSPQENEIKVAQFFENDTHSKS